MGMEQVNQQQLAIASNLSSVEGLDKLLRSELEGKTDADNSTKISESTLKKALEGKKGDVGNSILANLAAKLAQNLPTNKVLNSLKQDYDFMLSPQEDAAEDMIDIQNPVSTAAKQQKLVKDGQQGAANGDNGEAAGPRKAVSEVNEYVGAYSQLLVNGGQDAKKKMERIENQLLNDKGISLKDLKGLKVQVANSVRTEIMRQVKQAYLKQVLTTSKTLDGIIAKKEVNNCFDFAFSNDRIGGYDFGGKDENLQGSVDKATKEVRQELKDYVDDALTHEVVKKTMGNEGKGVEKEIDSLLKLGQKIGFDVQSFVAKIPQMKDDLGLNPLINFEVANSSANANMDNNNRERHNYQYTQEEEKEILTDKLRAVYLRRAMFGNSRTVLETQFKMIKLKNGLIKMGVKNFDGVETEGKALAKVKLVEMLHEAFEERATYAKLSGEAWKMTERKIKTVLKNLERLGMKLSQTELDQIRDKANEKMLREAEHELVLINTAIEAKGEIAYLTSKKKMVSDILERISTESGFQVPGHEIEVSIQEAC